MMRTAYARSRMDLGVFRVFPHLEIDAVLVALDAEDLADEVNARTLVRPRIRSQYRPTGPVEQCGNPHSSTGQLCQVCRECSGGAYPGAYPESRPNADATQASITTTRASRPSRAAPATRRSATSDGRAERRDCQCQNRDTQHRLSA